MFKSTKYTLKHAKQTNIILSCIFAATILTAPISVSDSNAAKIGASGLPLPRYVSLKSKRTNMRVGPGRDYKVEWMFTRRGLPIEILQEFDNWRKVRDPDGAEGWVLKSLLSGKRTAIVAPWKRGETEAFIKLRTGPLETTGTVAKIKPGVIANIDECVEGWCKMSINGYNGYIKQANLWGVYPDETLE